eukprot:scaffold1967_cov199-Alexandrium_tamarense.AAC.82
MMDNPPEWDAILSASQKNNVSVELRVCSLVVRRCSGRVDAFLSHVVSHRLHSSGRRSPTPRRRRISPRNTLQCRRPNGPPHSLPLGII